MMIINIMVRMMVIEIMVRMQVRVNLALRKKTIRMRMMMRMGLNLEIRVGVRRAIHQLRFNQNEYLSPHIALILLRFPSMDGGGTLESRPYLTMISP